MINMQAPQRDIISVIADEYIDAIYTQQPCDEGSDDDKLAVFAKKYNFDSACVLEDMLRCAADGTLRARVRAAV